MRATSAILIALLYKFALANMHVFMARAATVATSFDPFGSQRSGAATGARGRAVRRLCGGVRVRKAGCAGGTCSLYARK